VASSKKKSSVEKRALILWALLVKEGAAGFQKDLKPEPTKADRNALESDGLITFEKRGRNRRIWIEVTDKGWEWAGKHLHAPLPTNSSAGSQILQALLTRLNVFMQARNFVLADILGPQDSFSAQPAGDQSPKTTATTRVDHAPLRERIRRVYLEVTGGRLNARALLRDIRDKLKDVDRAALDEALKQMQKDQGASLYQLDNRAEVTAADMAAAIYFGNEPRHILWIER
jgi:hypothetical protein